MRLIRCVLVALAIGALGCGGGGGGSGGSIGSPPPPQPPAEEPPAEETPPEEPPEEPPQLGTSSAQLLFPWPGSSATASTVTVRGTASDADGVARLRVNGVEVPVVAVATMASPMSSVSSPVVSKQVATGVTGSVEANDAHTPKEVEWSTVVSLEQGVNALSIDVEDGNGEVKQGAASGSVRYTEVPVPFHLDSERLRFVGTSLAIAEQGYVSRLVAHDYETGEQTVYTHHFGATAGTCFKGDTDAFLYLLRTADSYQLRRFDLVVANDAPVVTIPLDQLDPGAGFDPSAHVEFIVCGAGHAHVYALVNFAPDGGGDFAKSRILRIELGSGAVDTLSQTDSLESPPWIGRRMALTADSIITVKDVSPEQPLTRVDLATGVRSAMTLGLDVGGLAIAPALDDEIVYVTTFDGVDEIDLGGVTPSRRNVSAVESDDPFVFSEVRSAAFDAANGRVLVGDSDLDMIIAVDVANGVRSDLVSRSVGDNVRLVAPRRMLLSPDITKAYVLDDGANAGERLFEIDLSTGERRTIGNIVQPFNVTATGLAVDDEPGHAYVSFDDTILKVEIDSGAVVAVANDATNGNLLQGVADLLLDLPNQRLLVADAVLDAVVAVDIVSGEQTILSQEGTAGEGPAFEDPNSLVLVDGETLYVSSQVTGTIMKVSAVNGDREIVLEQCLDDSSTNVLGTDGTLQQIHYNDARDELLILADNLLSFDPVGATCSVVLPFVANRGIVRLQATPQDQILGLTLGSLVQLDRQTGEVAIISR